MYGRNLVSVARSSQLVPVIGDLGDIEPEQVAGGLRCSTGGRKQSASKLVLFGEENVATFPIEHGNSLKPSPQLRARQMMFSPIEASLDDVELDSDVLAVFKMMRTREARQALMEECEEDDLASGNPHVRACFLWFRTERNLHATEEEIERWLQACERMTKAQACIAIGRLRANADPLAS